MELETVITRNSGNIIANIDCVLYLICTVGLTLKYFCININGRKLAKNINSAIVDWLSAKNDEEAYKIMRKQATKSRLCNLLMLYSAYICGSLFIVAVMVINIGHLFEQDQMVNVSDGKMIFPFNTY